MRVLTARARVTSVAILSAALLGMAAPAATGAAEPSGIDQFMRAIGSIESGGRYAARNPRTGAFGKYQILPSNWRTWARLYLGNANAAPTPRNQELVARAKFRSLHRWLQSWRHVAYWWLTGRDGRGRSWTGYARTYVERVMIRFKRTAAASGVEAPEGPEAVAARTLSEASKAITWTGTWALARHGGYQGGRAVYATEPGATASITFTGSRIAWLGPKGPTRGKARVLLDGVEVALVDLRSGSFQPRATVWSTTLPAAASHTLTIEVLGTSGRPYVAVDAFRITP